MNRRDALPKPAALFARALPVALLASAAAPSAHAQFATSIDLAQFGIDDVEITPDGRFAVARANELPTAVLVYDLLNGGAPIRHQLFLSPARTGPAQDAVLVTNERALVLGSPTYVLDLTAPGVPVLAALDLGEFPRDLALTPNGLHVVVRGGGPVATPTVGDNYVLDVTTGAVLASAPGAPGDYFQNQYPFDVDSAVATDRWGVVTSFVDDPVLPQTRVTVFDLQPAGGGAPSVAFETTSGTDLIGAPNDLALAPGGGFVAVRSEFEVGYLDLSGAAPQLAWTRALFNMPGPLGLSVMDSIEVTDTRIVTLSRWSNGGVGAQIDLFDNAGNQYYQLLFGDPHDLTITPSGERLVARTSTQVLLYDLVNLPATGNQLSVLDFQQLPSTHTSFGAGLDSIVASDRHAVACARVNETATVRVYDLSNDLLEVRYDELMPARPIDLELSPDAQTAWISGFTHAMGIDLRGMETVFELDPTVGGGYPWCDGVAVSEGHVVVFGYTVNPPAQTVLLPNSGWLAVIDTFRQPASFCSANPNSTGVASGVFATGSASAISNDLTVWASDLPQSVFGRFLYGDVAAPPAAMGDGFLCVGGNVVGFPVVLTGLDGVARQPIDNSALPAGGGALLPGTTWNFQFIHRDATSFGTGFNYSPALSIAFSS